MASRCWLTLLHNDINHSQTQDYTQKSPYSARSKTTEPHLLKLKRPLGIGACRKFRLWSSVGICIPFFPSCNVRGWLYIIRAIIDL